MKDGDYLKSYLFTAARPVTLHWTAENWRVKGLHHLTGLVDLKGSDMRVFSTLALLFMFFAADGYCSAEMEDESNRLVEAYLKAVNQNTGIEYFGGPFSIDQFNVSIEPGEKFSAVTFYKYITLSGQNKRADLFVGSYKYKRPYGIKGWPDSLEVWVSPALLDYPFRKQESIHIKNIEAFLNVGLSENDIKAIIKDLPAFTDRVLGEDTNVSLVKVEPEGEIKLTKETFVHIHSVYKLDSNSVQILFSPGFKSDIFQFSLGHSPLSFNWTGTSWEPGRHIKRLGLTDKHIVSSEQKFVLYGDIPEEDLKKLFDKAMRIPGILGLKAIKIRGDNATIYEGTPDVMDSPVFKSAIASITLQKTKEGWDILRTASVENADHDLLGDFDIPPLLPKPANISIPHLRKSLHIKETVSEEDIRKLAYFITRIPNTRYRITGLLAFKIREEIYVIVDEMYEEGFSINNRLFRFKKKNNSWIIMGSSAGDIHFMEMPTETKN